MRVPASIVSLLCTPRTARLQLSRQERGSYEDLRLSGLGLGLRLAAWLAFVSWTAVVAASLGLLVAVMLLSLPGSNHFPHFIYFIGTVWKQWKHGGKTINISDM